MDMSLIEITSRANFLIFNYIKRTLNRKDFAEQFRKTIQECSQKDIIVFKGLEDLTLVLKKYYSSQPAPLSNNGTSNSEESVKIAPEEPEDGGTSKQERKKKNKPEKQPEPVAQSGSEEPEPVEQQQSEVDSSRAERKRKKKRRQLEAEGGEQPDATANDHEMAAAPAETPAAADDEGEEGKAPKKKKKRLRTATDESVEQVDATVEQQPAPALTAASAEPAKAEEAAEAAEEGGVNSGKKSRQQKHHNEPYRRVREEEVINKHFHDNSFEAKPGATAGWGYKANEDLKPTQGRSFRHEKTKKKRGSYKGGAIDTGVSSFKFESDSE